MYTFNAMGTKINIKDKHKHTEKKNERERTQLKMPEFEMISKTESIHPHLNARYWHVSMFNSRRRSPVTSKNANRK